MRSQKSSLGLTVVLTMFAATLMTATRAAGQTETVLYDFTKNGGLLPYSGVVFDTAGNLCGTALAGGGQDVGVVYELIPSTGGGWTEKVLHNFTYTGTDGYDPYATPIFDTAGNLYGTTGFGGVSGFGTVFEMVRSAGGTWTEKVLFNFNTTSGEFPQAGLIFDASGNLYGTTSHGGSSSTTGACPYGVSITGCGTVFELKRKPGGGWTEKVLYNFNHAGTEAFNPIAGLIFDASGNLYGTTLYGGTHGYGTVFELTPTAGGTWTETTLHSFNHDGSDGFYPATGGLIFDASGNLYGTTGNGGHGANPQGTVFELTPGTGGVWTETVLHNFQRGDTDGWAAGDSSLIFDASGNLYGTTELGGASNKGIVFKLSPAGGGTWTETLLHQFGALPDGEGPLAGVVFDTAGNLYGTTGNGGDYKSAICGTLNCGTVFEIKP
jgi:uncharacterized repeat protein (TIGR03803 family)